MTRRDMADETKRSETSYGLTRWTVLNDKVPIYLQPNISVYVDCLVPIMDVCLCYDHRVCGCFKNI